MIYGKITLEDWRTACVEGEEPESSFESYNLRLFFFGTLYNRDTLQVTPDDTNAKLADLETTINRVILFKASRMARMFGNNLVFPFMDMELFRFLQELPVSLKCKGDSVLDIARGGADGRNHRCSVSSHRTQRFRADNKNACRDRAGSAPIHGRNRPQP